MLNNFSYVLKDLSLKDIELLRLYNNGKSLDSIASDMNNSPQEVFVTIRKGLGKISKAAKYLINDTGEIKRALHVSDEDLKAFNDSADILHRLKIIRKCLIMTMEYMSDFINITRQTYSDIENGIIPVEKYGDKIKDGFKSLVDDRYKRFIDICNEMSLANTGQYLDLRGEPFSELLELEDFFSLLPPEEKIILKEAVDRGIKEIRIQVLFYIDLGKFMYDLVAEEQQLKEILIKKETNGEKKDNLIKNIKQINNQKLYAEDLRQFIFSKLSDNNFQVTDSFIYEELFLPRIELTKKMINAALEFVKTL